MVTYGVFGFSKIETYGGGQLYGMHPEYIIIEIPDGFTAGAMMRKIYEVCRDRENSMVVTYIEKLR